VAALKERLATAEKTNEELSDFCTQAVARLAAQHEEIAHLRATLAGTASVTRLPASRTTVIGSGS
jgi:hypothetical protein